MCRLPVHAIRSGAARLGWLLFGLVLAGCMGSRVAPTTIPLPTPDRAATATRGAALTPRPPTLVARATVLASPTAVATAVVARATPPPPRATSTAPVPTLTRAPPTATMTPVVATPSPTPAVSGVAVRMQYERIDIRALQANPSAFTGRHVRIEGSIAMITRNADGSLLRVDVRAPGGSSADVTAVTATVFAPLPAIAQGDRVAVYGVIDRDVGLAIGAFGSGAAPPVLAIDYIDTF